MLSIKRPLCEQPISWKFQERNEYVQYYQEKLTRNKR